MAQLKTDELLVPLLIDINDPLIPVVNLPPFLSEDKY